MAQLRWLGMVALAGVVACAARSAPSTPIVKDIEQLVGLQRRAQADLPSACAAPDAGPGPDGGADGGAAAHRGGPRCEALRTCGEQVAQAAEACQMGAGSGPGCLAARQAAHKACDSLWR